MTSSRILALTMALKSTTTMTTASSSSTNNNNNKLTTVISSTFCVCVCLIFLCVCSPINQEPKPCLCITFLSLSLASSPVPYNILNSPRIYTTVDSFYFFNQMRNSISRSSKQCRLFSFFLLLPFFEYELTHTHTHALVFSKRLTMLVLFIHSDNFRMYDSIRRMLIVDTKNKTAWKKRRIEYERIYRSKTWNPHT